MKFFALIVAAVALMSSVEANEQLEQTDLMSAVCKNKYARFNRTYRMIDANNTGKIYKWEWLAFAKKQFGTRYNARVQRSMTARFNRWAGSKGYITRSDVWSKIKGAC